MNNKLGPVILLSILAALSVGRGLAQDNQPATTADGLEQIAADKVDAVYRLPGATLVPYERIAILEPFVAFRKDWQRDQNRDRPGTNRVSVADMERIKSMLSQEFRTAFTKVLEEGGYDIVDVAADDVLVLRPAIVNLDVAAPDLQSPGGGGTFVTSAGSMTLYMELYDSATSQLIGRVVDSRRAVDRGTIHISSSVSNRAEAVRMFTRWATLLREALDENMVE
jgi:hypothetical protein